jgi:hypothetical protein
MTRSDKGSLSTSYSASTLAVLRCIYVLTNDTGRCADMTDVAGLLRETYRMSDSEATAAIEVARMEGAVE